ncbi:MAG: PDZ domain-containing protein [Candidatus Falkowbacteria bacterium]
MSRNNKIFLLITTAILSLIGGVVGGIIVRLYLINSSFNLPLFGDINLGSQYDSGSIIISQPKKVVVEQNNRVQSIITEARKSLIIFYKKKVITKDSENFNLNNYYSPQDKIGEGLVLTNDGWIITTLNLSRINSFVAVDHEQNILEIEKSIFDNQTGYYFIKLKANNLVAVQFAERNNIADGQMLISVNQEDSRVSYIEESDYYIKGAVFSSEKLYRLIKINKEDLIKGEAQFSLDGSVAGFYSAQGVVVPISHITMFLPQILKEGEITRSNMGITYINLHELVGEEKITGALIKTIVRRSSADTAGLQTGDIILEIDGTKIDQNNNLSELIQKQESGSEIELLILREDEEERVKVELE